MFKFRMLMNAADKGGPGGTPAPTTPDIGAMVAAAVKESMAEVTRSLSVEMNKAIHGALKAAAKKGAPPPPPQPKPDDDPTDDDDDDDVPTGETNKGAAAAIDPKIARRIKQLEKRDKDREAERATEKAAAEAKALELQRREDRAALTAALTGKVRPELLEATVALHFDSKKRIGRDEDDAEKRVWRDGDDVLTIEEGVAKWLTSPEGKAYVPPTDAKGSGNGGNKGSVTVGTDGKRVYSDADIGQLVTGGIPGFTR